MWIQADFILDIKNFGRVAFRKVFQGDYGIIQYYNDKQDYMGQCVKSAFPNAKIAKISEIDQEGKSGYKIIECYTFNEDPSLIYAVHVYGEEAHHSVLCIHPSFSFCVEYVLKLIVKDDLRYVDVYCIETWKDGIKIESIEIE